METLDARRDRLARMSTLPSDDVRQIMWRFADRYDLQLVVQSARSVARGLVARLVSTGARHAHEWTPEKAQLLQAFDASGITSLFIDPEYGGYFAGPKNLALALVAFEMAWVDGGAATCALAGDLALEPIHLCGTPEQKRAYMSRCVPAAPGERRPTWRGAFCLTEPLPYVGVDTGVLGGKVRVAEWAAGKEPVLQVDKRGRFITNMDFANFVTAAVAADDPRIRGTCMVVLEETDPGTFDRGAPTRKLVHQLSSTRDPIFSLKVPASRIIGGYEVRDGVIVPNHSHGEVIDAVFRRTRITVGLMTAAKLLSSIEPIIRYHRGRFRGGESGAEGSPRHDLGLQQKEDALHRLIDVWATGEASASLGFAAARLFDEMDALQAEGRKDGARDADRRPRGRREIEALALEHLELAATPAAHRDAARFEALQADRDVQGHLRSSLAAVLVPACKLWNTGHGANMMREAVSLMGGYGITEDCPGFLGQKWMDAQLEATYEGPEAVQRRQLGVTMVDPVFLAQFRRWILDQRRLANRRPGSGACTLASAMELWIWTIEHLLAATDAEGKALYRDRRQGVTFPMADALAWLLASRCQMLDLIELDEEAPHHPVLKDDAAGFVSFFTDLCHVQAARAAGEVGRICAALVFGYNRHPAWDGAAAMCYGADELQAMESIIPGIVASARGYSDVFESDGSHAAKAGPCVRFEGLESFVRLRRKLDGCSTGARLAKDHAARVLTTVMIPEALDYPM
jgi:alkylation response protein AidB-like acyl-CoA dehydrogenase